MSTAPARALTALRERWRTRHGLAGLDARLAHADPRAPFEDPLRWLAGVTGWVSDSRSRPAEAAERGRPGPATRPRYLLQVLERNPEWKASVSPTLRSLVRDADGLKKLLAVAVAGVFAAPAAFAQSSVVISGQIKGGYESLKIGNYSSTRALGNSSQHGVVDDSSRIIFNIREDLGGGLAAIGQLDMRVKPDDAPTTAGTGIAQHVGGTLVQGNSHLAGRASPGAASSLAAKTCTTSTPRATLAARTPCARTAFRCSPTAARA